MRILKGIGFFIGAFLLSIGLVYADSNGIYSSYSSDLSTTPISGLTASKPVFTDTSKVLTSSGTVPIDQGGTGQTTASSAFGVLKQVATDAITGVSELATDVETVTGTATDRVTTPANITAKMASPGAIGGNTPAAGSFTTLKASTDPVDEHGVGDRGFNDGRYALPNTNYGEMYLNANSTETIIETASTPIGLRQFTAGQLDGWAFDAGSTAAITAYADYSGTVTGTVLATSTHGLTTDDIISIRGTTNYNGFFQITVVDSTHFYFIDSWVADDGASDFDEPSHLIAEVSVAGDYEVSWNMSSTENGAAGSTFLFCVYQNTIPHNTTIVQRKFANNDVGAFGGGGVLVSVVSGDWLFLIGQSTGVNTITNGYGALVITAL